MRKLLIIILICFMIIAMYTGCGLLQKLGLQGSNNGELHPVSSIVMNEDDAKKLTDKVPIHLYFANEENTKLKLQIRYIPMSEAKKSVNNLATLILKELINGPEKNSGLKATIPDGTKLGTRIKIDNATAVATVDFSQEFVNKHPGGKIAEQLTLYSVVNTLTELKEIKKVRFTIAGKSMKEYKGNYQFDVPFPRVASLISKDAAIPNPTPNATLNPTMNPTSNPTLKPEIKDKEKSKNTNGEILDQEGNSTNTLNASGAQNASDADQFME